MSTLRLVATGMLYGASATLLPAATGGLAASQGLKAMQLLGGRSVTTWLAWGYYAPQVIGQAQQIGATLSVPLTDKFIEVANGIHNRYTGKASEERLREYTILRQTGLDSHLKTSSKDDGWITVDIDKEEEAPIDKTEEAPIDKKWVGKLRSEHVNDLNNRKALKTETDKASTTTMAVSPEMMSELKKISGKPIKSEDANPMVNLEASLPTDKGNQLTQKHHSQ